MKQLFYSIEVRDKEGKLYTNSLGNKVIPFRLEDKEVECNKVQSICEELYSDYQAVCKEGSQINIDVRYHNVFTKTYSLLYSFYGENQKFIKHT